MLTVALETLPPFFQMDDPRSAQLTVAIVSHSHPVLSKGGAEISAYGLFRALREIGVDAIFIAACSMADRHRLVLADDNEFAVYYDGERYEHFYQLAPRGVVDQLARILRDEKVKVVNFHHFLNFGVNSLRAIRGIPGVRCFITLHEFLAICHNHGQMITFPSNILCERATNEGCVACFPGHLRSEFVLRKESMLEAFGGFDGFISPSRFLAERFIEWGLKRERVAVVENGIAHQPSSARKRKSGAKWTFGFFGQINPFKGVDVILDAAELIATEPELANRVRFRIHGNLVGQSQDFIGRFEDTLRRLSNFTYAGPYNSASVDRLMAECDYVVIPSKWWENSPLVIQEAYSVAVPVICSGVGGMAEKVIDNVSGMHFQLGDATDLVRAIRAAANEEQAARLRAGIPRVASTIDMARNYLALFSSDSREMGSPSTMRVAAKSDSGAH